MEVSNISTGGPNIFEIIFDNVEEVSGDFYTGYYLKQEWEFRDDMLYIFRDSNRNSKIDKNDELLIETNLGNDYLILADPGWRRFYFFIEFRKIIFLI